jgi:hypothetical protein
VLTVVPVESMLVDSAAGQERAASGKLPDPPHNPSLCEALNDAATSSARSRGGSWPMAPESDHAPRGIGWPVARMSDNRSDQDSSGVAGRSRRVWLLANASRMASEKNLRPLGLDCPDGDRDITADSDCSYSTLDLANRPVVSDSRRWDRLRGLRKTSPVSGSMPYTKPLSTLLCDYHERSRDKGTIRSEDSPKRVLPAFRGRPAALQARSSIAGLSFFAGSLPLPRRRACTPSLQMHGVVHSDCLPIPPALVALCARAWSL